MRNLSPTLREKNDRDNITIIYIVIFVLSYIFIIVPAM